MTGEILGQDDGLTLGKITVFRTFLYLDWTVGKEFGQDDELTWVGKVTYEGHYRRQDGATFYIFDWFVSGWVCGSQGRPQRTRSVALVNKRLIKTIPSTWIAQGDPRHCIVAAVNTP